MILRRSFLVARVLFWRNVLLLLLLAFLLPATTQALLTVRPMPATTTTSSTRTTLNSFVAGKSSSSNASSKSTTKQQQRSKTTKSPLAVPWDWKRVAKQAFEQDDRPIILFDGVCNLCNGGVNFAIDHDPKAKFRFVSLQSKIGQSLLLQNGKCPDDISSIVLCFAKKSYFKSDAILRIAQELEGFGVLSKMGMAVPLPLRDVVYRMISENRYRFSETFMRDASCRLDFDGEYDNRFLDDDPSL